MKSNAREDLIFEKTNWTSYHLDSTLITSSEYLHLVIKFTFNFWPISATCEISGRVVSAQINYRFVNCVSSHELPEFRWLYQCISRDCARVGMRKKFFIWWNWTYFLSEYEILRLPFAWLQLKKCSFKSRNTQASNKIFLFGYWY